MRGVAPGAADCRIPAAFFFFFLFSGIERTCEHIESGSIALLWRLQELGRCCALRLLSIETQQPTGWVESPSNLRKECAHRPRVYIQEIQQIDQGIDCNLSWPPRCAVQQAVTIRPKFLPTPTRGLFFCMIDRSMYLAVLP